MNLLLALFFWANFAYSTANTEPDVKTELQNIITTYSRKATLNAEFDQWIDKVYYASRKSNSIYLEEQMEVFYGFTKYNEKRKFLENKMKRRIREIDNLLADEKLDKRCHTLYGAQKSVLSKSFNFSNDRKERILEAKSKNCVPRRKPKPKAITKSTLKPITKSTSEPIEPITQEMPDQCKYRRLFGLWCPDFNRPRWILVGGKWVNQG